MNPGCLRARSAHLVLPLCAGFLAAAGSTPAQTTEPAPLPAHAIGITAKPLRGLYGLEFEEQLREANRWVADYTAWKRWDQQWISRREPGWFGARDRKQKPDPPAWLAEDCHDQAYAEGILIDACRLLADWKDDLLTASIRAQTTVQRTQDEAPTKTVWWEHVHLDALWAMPQVNAHVYGLIGMHTTVEVAGRLQVFLTPGAIVLNLPTARGGREWRAATDWGVAYRLSDFKFPGTERRASLHLNLATAWIFGGPSNLVRNRIDLAGLSLTFKPRPPAPPPAAP